MQTHALAVEGSGGEEVKKKTTYNKQQKTFTKQINIYITTNPFTEQQQNIYKTTNKYLLS